MKAKIPSLTAACLAACILCVSPALAQGKKSPAPDASASPGASAAATEKAARPTAYRGKILSVDASAKTFTVGKHTIKVTDETKITKNDAAAAMSDIVADEQVRGSYWKKEDGSLEAKSVKLGAKTAGKAKSGAKTDAAEASPSAEPKK
ncbi:MAG: DUF5666 domain-containing protein [Verrucomicrobiota bacterium]|nr:hypothetical protein [Chthoniobacterales bacterium]MDQ3414853.1 DUF5666 domain-containing protein [Verrucomicrobiota bacterium]